MVSCKSWQSGFNPASEIAALQLQKTKRGRQAWQAFRELCVPKWSEAFRAAIRRETGAERFTYVTAVAKLTGDRAVWETYRPFQDALGDNPVQLITFLEMATDIQGCLTTTLAATEMGRMLQMFTAAGIRLPPVIAKDATRSA